MFPRMRQRLGSALRENLDLLVEFSTLGEYGLMDPGETCPPARAGRVSAEPAARLPLPTGSAPCVSRRVRRPGAPDAPEQVCLTALR
jgi:hypothetical protein